MTNDDRSLLNDLKTNTAQLFLLFSQMETERKQLEGTILSLNQEVEKLKQEIAVLDRRHEQLKVATQMVSGKDENREARQKINKLVREIDKCIALLNK